MEIQGRKPSASVGKKLRLEFWIWRPIQALMVQLCSDLLAERMLTEMAFGRGAGPTSQAICTEIARRLEAWQVQHPEGAGLESGIRMTEEGRFLTEQELADNPTLKTRSPYHAAPRDLQRWIDFLKSCGGFEVW